MEKINEDWIAKKFMKDERGSKGEGKSRKSCLHGIDEILKKRKVRSLKNKKWCVKGCGWSKNGF